MNVTLERQYRDAQPFEVAHIAFDGHGFRLKRAAAEQLLDVLQQYYNGSLQMAGKKEADKLIRFYSDSGLGLVEQRPANAQGVFTNGTLDICINDSFGYFTLSDNESKAFMVALEKALA